MLRCSVSIGHTRARGLLRPLSILKTTEHEMPENAILQAYRIGVIGSGINGQEKKEMIVTTNQVAAQSIPLSASQKSPKRPVIKIKVVCTHATKTNCNRKFADKACCKAVASNDCNPPGSVRMLFVDGTACNDVQVAIASGVYVRGNK